MQCEKASIVGGTVQPNGLRFLERPEETKVKARPYVLSMPFKDYTIRKVEAGYFVTGAVIHREQAAVLESRDYLVRELSKVFSFRCHP